jgi:hypothetical protein
MSLYLPPLVMLAVLGNGEEIGLGIDVRMGSVVIDCSSAGDESCCC